MENIYFPGGTFDEKSMCDIFSGMRKDAVVTPPSALHTCLSRICSVGAVIALVALVMVGCPDNPLDTDGDGIPDTEDPDIDGDGILNAEDPDDDGDGTGDLLEECSNRNSGAAMVSNDANTITLSLSYTFTPSTETGGEFFFTNVTNSSFIEWILDPTTPPIRHNITNNPNGIGNPVFFRDERIVFYVVSIAPQFISGLLIPYVSFTNGDLDSLSLTVSVGIVGDPSTRVTITLCPESS